MPFHRKASSKSMFLLFFEAFTVVAQIFVSTEIRPTKEFSATRKCGFEECLELAQNKSLRKCEKSP
jgi:hypothetical protein